MYLHQSREYHGRYVHGEDPAGKERVNELEETSTKLETERDKARRSILILRKRVSNEQEVRARLEGVVEDQERRLEELSTEKSRLEGRIRELDNRLIFLDGGEDELPQPVAWWNRPVVWIRIAVVAVVLFTFNAAGAAYWGNFDKRLDARLSSFQAQLVGSESTEQAENGDPEAEVPPPNESSKDSSKGD